MRVNGTPTGQTDPGLNLANANRFGTAEGVTGDGSAAYEAVAAGSSRSDFQDLVNTLDRIPFIRQEIVGEVARQLNAGELDTPRARQQTVESMLGASRGHD